jgi:AcrR family transcriptional regulator
VNDRLPHSQRSDALDNRDRILEAAREAFADEGLDVPMREIARRAEVGPATLYRHFATKELLATEAFADQMRACRAIVDEGLAEPDPWDGFRHAFEKLCELHARSRGFTAAFISAYPRAIDLVAEREYAISVMSELADGAKAAGRLRPDFVIDDFVLMLMAHSGIQANSPATSAKASRRFAMFAIQAFQATEAAHSQESRRVTTATR